MTFITIEPDEEIVFYHDPEGYDKPWPIGYVSGYDGTGWTGYLDGLGADEEVVTGVNKKTAMLVVLNTWLSRRA